MPTLASVLKQKKPDVYTADDDVINAAAIKALNSPIRGQYLQKLRGDLGTPSDVKDESLEATVRKLAGSAPSSPAPPTAGQMSPVDASAQDLKDTRQGKQKQALGLSYQSLMQKQGVRSQPDLNPPSPHVEGVLKEANDEIAPPETAMTDENGLPPRTPVLEDWQQDMLPLFAKAKKAGMNPRFAIPGKGLGFQVLLLDGNNKPIAALHEKAAFDQSMIPGVNMLPRLMGTGSHVKSNLAQAAKDTAQFLGDKSLDDLPDTGTAVGMLPGQKGSTALGFREIGGRSGAAAGRESPRAAMLGAKLTGGAIYPIMRGMQGWDALQGILDRGVEGAAGGAGWNDLKAGAGEWAKENEQSAALEGRNARDIEDLIGTDLGKLPPEQLKEMGSVAGEYRGKELGEWADLLAPTEGTIAAEKVAGPILKGAAGMLPRPVRAVGRLAKMKATGAGRDVVDAVVNSPLNKPINLFSDNPAKLALEPAKREAIDAAALTSKNMAGTAREAMQRDLRDAQDEILTRAGVDPSERAAVISGAAQKSTTREGLRSATPVEAELHSLWMKAKDRIVEEGKASGAFTEDMRANPLHDYYGQDVTKKAKVLATDLNREAWDTGEKAVVGDTHVVGESHPLERWEQDLTPGSTIQDAIPREDKIRAMRQGWEDMPWLSRPARAEMDAHVKEVRAMVPEEALPRAMEDVLVASGKPQKTAVADLHAATENFARHDPRFTTVADLEKRVGSSDWQLPNEPRMQRDAYGNMRPVKVQQSPVESALRGDGLVILHAQGGKTPRGVWKGVDVELPERFGAEWDGKVVPRSWAQAMQGATAPSGELMSSKGREVARLFDRWLGINQQKAAITRGNMGFDARNRVNEVLRILAEEGDRPLRTDLRKAVSEISNAPLNRPSGKFVTIGGQRVDTGLLHTQLRLQGVMKSGWKSEASKEAGEAAGSGRVLEMLGVGKPVNKLAQLARAPGEASSRAANRVFREPFNVGGVKLHPDYEAEDGLRMLTVLSKMDRGQKISSAVKDMKSLLIDYGDKNWVEQVGSVGIPFIKYYTGAAEGALRIAANNPRTFSRAADFARMMETYDQTVHGGALDPRAKTVADKLAMNPQIQFGGRQAVIRNEAPSTELANFAGALSGEDPQDWRRYLSPLANQISATASGKDPITDRSLYGFDKEQMGEADPGIYNQWAQAKKQDEFYGDQNLLGPHPNMQLAYMLARHLPVAGGRLLTPQVDMLARSLADLGGSSAARTPEDAASANEAGMFTALSGIRIPKLDSQAQTLKSLQNANQAIPTAPIQQRGRRRSKGRQR